MCHNGYFGYVCNPVIIIVFYSFSFFSLLQKEGGVRIPLR